MNFGERDGTKIGGMFSAQSVKKVKLGCFRHPNLLPILFECLVICSLLENNLIKIASLPYSSEVYDSSKTLEIPNPGIKIQ